VNPASSPYRTPALLPPSASYLARDFDSLRARLIELAESAFPEWTDHEVASFGDMLLELFAFVGDVLGYYLDAQIRETRLVTATQRRSVIQLARMLGYRLRGAQAATAVVDFALDAPADADVLVPAGRVLRTAAVTDPVRFQLLSDVTLYADQTRAEGVVEHSENQTKVVDARGLSGGDVVLDRTPYLDGSARITAGNGDYEERDSLLGSGPNDRHFLALVDQNDRATIRFGDGWSGAVPTGTIRVTYKTGGGAAGNVDPNTIRVLDATVNDIRGRPAHLSVTNAKRASGGIERQSIASAKLLAPESLRAPARTVAREDFEIHARELSSVARALMLTSDEDPTIEENTGILYVVPAGGGLPTPALKNAALRQVTEVYPCTLTFQPRVQDPVYRAINVDARVFLTPPVTPAMRQVIGARIRGGLRDFFRIANPDGTPNLAIDFGLNLVARDGDAEITWSRIFDVIDHTPGVWKLEPYDLKLNGLPADVKLAPQEFPILGEVRLVDSSTGSLL
jgi:hypothetical protein